MSHEVGHPGHEEPSDGFHEDEDEYGGDEDALHPGGRRDEGEGLQPLIPHGDASFAEGPPREEHHDGGEDGEDKPHAEDVYLYAAREGGAKAEFFLFKGDDAYAEQPFAGRGAPAGDEPCFNEEHGSPCDG